MSSLIFPTQVYLSFWNSNCLCVRSFGFVPQVPKALLIFFFLIIFSSIFRWDIFYWSNLKLANSFSSHVCSALKLSQWIFKFQILYFSVLKFPPKCATVLQPLLDFPSFNSSLKRWKLSDLPWPPERLPFRRYSTSVCWFEFNYNKASESNIKP